MRLTKRDLTILRDIALSHLLSRDQLMSLGYFNSITRVNTRLRELIRAGLVKRLETPFFGQGLYTVTKQASEVVGERISPFIEGRSSSPRFIQHALAVTNVRIALCQRSAGTWRFEQQLWRKLSGQQPAGLRPDGLLVAKTPIFVEVDMGHVALSRFKEKLISYSTLAKSDSTSDLYGFDTFRLLTVTTGNLRSRHLRRLRPSEAGFDYMVQTFEELGLTPPYHWS